MVFLNFQLSTYLVFTMTIQREIFCWNANERLYNIRFLFFYKHVQYSRVLPHILAAIYANKVGNFLCELIRDISSICSKTFHP